MLADQTYGNGEMQTTSLKGQEQVRITASEKGIHGVRWSCLMLGRPAWVGLLRVPVWSNEIRLGHMSAATGGYNWRSKPWLPHSERGCHVSFPGGLQTDIYSPQKTH